jgi:hypothetical protein
VLRAGWLCSVNDFHDDYNWHSKGENVKNKVVIKGWTVFSIWLTLAAAWVTHVVACIKTGSMMLLVLGTVFPPYGWIHGFGSWFGWF